MRLEIGELADVVQQRGASQYPALVGLEAEDDGDPVGELGHALRVTGGERRFGVDDARERFGDAVQASVVGRDRQLQRLPLRDVGRLELGPELGVAAEAQEGIDQRGVKPAPASAFGDRARGADAAVGVEHLDRLGEAQHTGRQRDLLAAQPVGHTAAVPVLVETADRRGGVLREEQHARDLGAPVAPGRHEAACDLALVTERSQHRDAPPQPRPGSRRAQRPQQRGAFAGPVDELRARFGCAVVRREQRRHAVRVRRAAGILEQQGIEEIGALGRVEIELGSQAHADQARPNRVTRPLAFSDVERMRQRADHARERYLRHNNASAALPHA